MYEAIIDLLVVLFGHVLKPEIVTLFHAQPAATFADQVLNEDNQIVFYKQIDVTIMTSSSKKLCVCSKLNSLQNVYLGFFLF